MQNDTTNTDEESTAMSRINEECSARLDAALAEGQAAKELVRDLYRLVKRNGGFSWPADQMTMRRAATYLVDWDILP
jgi:DNA-binding phage protein